MSLNVHKLEGSGAPGFTPTRVADHYTDTTNHVAYISINTSSSSDWLQLPGGGWTGVTDGDKGDIVVSSSGTSWLFDSSVVTAAAKTVLDDSTVAAMRATLGIKQAEVANFVIGPASHADAAEFDYTTDGTDDEIQINAALVALPANGGTILIRDGTYNLGDFVSIPSNCTIILAPGCVIKPETNYAPTSQTIDGYTMRSMFTNSDHTSGNTKINIIGTGRITAEGVTIPNPNTVAGPSFAAIWFHKTTESTIGDVTVDNILWNITGGELTGVRQYGVLFTESHRNQILFCHIHHVGNDCISLRRDSSDNLVMGVLGRYSLYGHSVGQDTSGAALFLGTAGADIQNNKWIGCTAIGDPATASIACAGVVSHSGKNTLISNCISYTCGLGFALAGDAKGCTIRDCTVVDPVHYGIWLRTDASGDNNDNSISHVKVRMTSTTLYGLYVHATALNDDTNRVSIYGVHVTGTSGASQKGFYFNGGGGAISDYHISNCMVTDCGAEGLLIDSTSTNSAIGRFSINGFHARSCLYGIRIGAITAAGTVTNGYINDCWVNSSVASSVGISLEATSGWIIDSGRIRVSGIAVKDDASSSSNRVFFTDTTSSGTVAPQMAGTSSRAVGFDYGATGGTGSIVFATQPTLTGPVSVVSATNGIKVGSDLSATTITDATTKGGTLVCPHYTNSEEPVAGLVMSSAVGSTVVGVGGGSGDANTATEVRLYYAGNNTTTTGTIGLTLGSTGIVNIPGSLTLGTPLAAAQGGTGITSLGTGIATFLGTPSSANLAAAITNETGTGLLVFNDAPNFSNGFTVGGLTTKASNGGIDIASGGIGIVVGADSAATTRTDATTKVSRIASPHYTNAEEPLALVVASSTSSASTVYIGGGSASNNSATDIILRTAANNTTLTGSDRLTINSSGVVNIPGSLTLGTALAVAQGGTGSTTAKAAFDALNGAEATVASATTTDIGAASSDKVSITGTTTITGFGTVTAGVRRSGRFTGALTLTHNATSLILPGAANITTTAGDRFEAVSLGSGNWVVYNYEYATHTGTGAPVHQNSPSLTTPNINVASATSVNKWVFTAPSTAATLTAGGDSLTYTLPSQTCNIGYLEVPQNSQSTAYTCVLSDNGKHILHPSADTTARTFTIPANASVAYPIGASITFVNQASAGTVTISINTDTMRLAGAGTTGSRTLAANGIATALKITSTEWIINGTGLT